MGILVPGAPVRAVEKCNLAAAYLLEYAEEPGFSRIRAAWRADQERVRWISIDPDSVDCWNEAAGFS